MPSRVSLRRAALGGVAAVTFALSACGGGPAAGEVTGAVTLDGQPLPSGSIAFVPADGKGPTAGGVITDGQYKAKVPVGNVKVMINGLGKVTGTRKDPASGRDIPITEAGVGPKFNGPDTPLKATVTAGPNTHDFQVTSDKPGDKK